MEKYKSFETQNKNKAENVFEIDFYKVLNNSFYGKTMENVPNRVKVKFIQMDDEDKFIKQQSKLTFNGNHKSYTVYDSYTFKPNKFCWINRFTWGFLY